MQSKDEDFPNYFRLVAFGAGEGLLVTDTLAVARLYLSSLIHTYSTSPSCFLFVPLSCSLYLSSTPIGCPSQCKYTETHAML